MALIRPIPTTSSKIEDILTVNITSEWAVLINDRYIKGANPFPLTGNNFSATYDASGFTFTITKDCNVFLIAETSPTNIIKNEHMSAGETLTVTLSDIGNGFVFATF